MFLRRGISTPKWFPNEQVLNISFYSLRIVEKKIGRPIYTCNGNLQPFRAVVCIDKKMLIAK